jgi:hypothetical protein
MAKHFLFPLRYYHRVTKKARENLKGARFMTKGELSEIAENERRKYFRAWRAANPDKTRRHRENYWINRAKKILAEQENSASLGQVKKDEGAK